MDPKTKQLYEQIVRSHNSSKSFKPSKAALLATYRQLVANKSLEANKKLEAILQKKPVRTLSGVTPVTVLTKPYPCPGECIFCPTDIRMPKSYIASEPGAQRAAQNAFDPYAQVISRLKTYLEIGHDISKIELIVLGGTWSVYPESYQIWFIKRLFEALNEFGTENEEKIDARTIDLDEKKPEHVTYNSYISGTKYLKTTEFASFEELFYEHRQNQTASHRCVGLVLETRPDYTTEHEVIKLRRLGATKIQVGIQSLDDRILSLNKRGHQVGQTAAALALLRQAGFKIHAHWMPNLYGSSVIKDKEDYQKLFSDPLFCPDELKIYPCSLIADTELVSIYKSGKWQPYTHDELNEVIAYCLTHTPEYCRLTRVVRDIPSQEILEGNKHTNFRQMVESKIDQSLLNDIRSREIKGNPPSKPILDVVAYKTSVSNEHFLQYITPDRRIVAFLRLSLPTVKPFIKELENKAIIREIHVYGQAIAVGHSNTDASQHQGFGTRLIADAVRISKANGFSALAVISAIGTKEYYRKKGFTDGELYQHLDFSQ